MSYPSTVRELQTAIAQETARMSFPGSMGRGRHQVVKAGTKKQIETYFVSKFRWHALWNQTRKIAGTYDTWHKRQTKSLGAFLDNKNCLGNPRNDSLAVATKFLNTFMYQLMKYKRFRLLWSHLHLPLDGRVFQAFKQAQEMLPASCAIQEINNCIGNRTAYSISYADYQFIQNKLWDFISDLNRRQGAQFLISSRIELNYFWI